jgi:hypothetical protein
MRLETPIVLSHALGMRLEMWDGLAAQLAAHHQVLRYGREDIRESAVMANAGSGAPHASRWRRLESEKTVSNKMNPAARRLSSNRWVKGRRVHVRRQQKSSLAAYLREARWPEGDTKVLTSLAREGGVKVIGQADETISAGVRSWQRILRSEGGHKTSHIDAKPNQPGQASLGGNSRPQEQIFCGEGFEELRS